MARYMYPRASRTWRRWLDDLRWETCDARRCAARSPMPGPLNTHRKGWG